MRQAISAPTPKAGLFARDDHIRSWWLLLTLLIIAAALLRIPALTLNSFWLDEIYTAAVTMNPFVESILDAIQDSHPPLFHMAISTWSLVFGQSELALRSFSASVGIITIPILFFMLRASVGTRVALAFAGLVTVLPGYIYYSQEIRSYAMTFLAAGIAISMLLRYIQEPSKKNKWLLAASCGLLFLCHYISILLIGGIGLAVAVGVNGQAHQRLKTFISASTAIAVIILPLSGHMIYHRIAGYGFWASPMDLPKAYDVLFALSHYDLFLGLVLYLLCALAIYRAWVSTNHDLKRITAAAAVVAFSPLLVGFVAAFATPDFNILLPRTMLVLGPGIVLLAAIGLAGFALSLHSIAVFTVVCAGSAFWLWSTGFYSLPTKSDIRGASEEIARLEQQAPSIIVVLDGDWFCQPIGAMECGRPKYYFRMFDVKGTLVAPNRRKDPDQLITEIIATARKEGAKQLILASFNEPELEKLYTRVNQRFEPTSLKIFTGTVPDYEVTINRENVPGFTFVASYALP